MVWGHWGMLSLDSWKQFSCFPLGDPRGCLRGCGRTLWNQGLLSACEKVHMLRAWCGDRVYVHYLFRGWPLNSLPYKKALCFHSKWLKIFLLFLHLLIMWPWMNQRAPEVAPHQPQGGSAPLSQGLADIKWEGGLSSPPFILGGASGQRMEGRPLLWRAGSPFHFTLLGRHFPHWGFGGLSCMSMNQTVNHLADVFTDPSFAWGWKMNDAWGFPHSAFLVECDGTPVIS